MFLLKKKGVIVDMLFEAVKTAAKLIAGWYRSRELIEVALKVALHKGELGHEVEYLQISGLRNFEISWFNLDFELFLIAQKIRHDVIKHCQGPWLAI